MMNVYVYTSDDYLFEILKKIIKDFNIIPLNELSSKTLSSAADSVIILSGETNQIKESLKKIKKEDTGAQPIVLSPTNKNSEIFSFLKEGAYSVIKKSENLKLIKEEIKKAYEKINFRQILKFHNLDFEISSNPEMQRVFYTIRQAASSDTNVLICGESGVGKEIAARQLHFLSARANRVFIPINCAAINANLLESELFGYEKGAFTGAHRTKKGLIEIASQGTLFLDEIGDLPLSLQPKLLRVIETKKIIKLGAEKEIPAAARFVFATNQDLYGLVKEGKFREDLYYRINVVKINIPPLRERKEDIIKLAVYYMNFYSSYYNKKIKTMDNKIIETLTAYSWPGNIRQLKNTMENMIVLADGEKLKYESLPGYLKDDITSKPGKIAAPSLLPSLNIKELEKLAIDEALKKTNNNKTKAAELLGISLRTLWRKIK